MLIIATHYNARYSLRGVHMRALAGIALLFGFVGNASADTFNMIPHAGTPKAKGVYACRTIDGVSVNDDGRLLRDHWADWFIEDYAEFQFDASSGKFVGNEQTLQWVVLRPGDSSWDLVAHLPGADTSFNMMRIEVWNDPIRFVMTNGKAFFSGTCQLE